MHTKTKPDPRRNRRLMLISNSQNPHQEYLEHCLEAIRKFLGRIKNITFIPYAAEHQGWRDYENLLESVLRKIDVKSIGLDRFSFREQRSAIEHAEAVFVGGGNTFRLLANLYIRELLQPICKRVNEGMPYIGSSAGANVACPTIKTTNDMPVVYPPSFDGLNLIPFQINPHFVEKDPNSAPGGQTREGRITDYQSENPVHVIGLREGSWIIVEHGIATFHGPSAKSFVPYRPATEWSHPLGLW